MEIGKVNDLSPVLILLHWPKDGASDKENVLDNNGGVLSGRSNEFKFVKRRENLIHMSHSFPNPYFSYSLFIRRSYFCSSLSFEFLIFK